MSQTGRTNRPSAAPATPRAAPRTAGTTSSRPPDAPARASLAVTATATRMGPATSRADSGSRPSASATMRSISSAVGTKEERSTTAEVRGGITTMKTPAMIARTATIVAMAATDRGKKRSSQSTKGMAVYAIRNPRKNGRSAGQVPTTTASAPPITAEASSARPSADGVTVASRALRSAHAARERVRAASRSFST